MLAKAAQSMKINRRRGLFRLWLAGTLALLIGAGLILRPDRDAAQYLNYQHVEVDETNLQTRQLMTQIRHLRSEGLAFDQIKDKVLSNGAPTAEIVDKTIELEANLSAKAHAERRLTLFAAIALVPPLVILELGAALFCARRGYKISTNVLRQASLDWHRVWDPVRVLRPVTNLLRQFRLTGLTNRA